LDTKKFILLISAMTAVICALTVVYNFASMPAYGDADVSAVALYSGGGAASSGDFSSQASSETEISSSGTSSESNEPSAGASTRSSSANSAKTNSSKTSSHKPSTSSAAKTTPSHPVNLNTATLAQLETVPNIGAARAQDIIDYRNAHGSFSSIDELDKVKGFGAKMIENVRPYLTL